MSKLKLKIKLFTTGICLTGVLLFPLETLGAGNTRALDLMQQGYAECKNAHLLRRKDLDQAKLAYDAYLDFKEQASVLDTEILLNGNEEVGRIVSYCDTVGADILRTEALPVFALGVNACGEAAEHLRNNQLVDAKQAYEQYLRHKEEAVLITDAILEVFSVRTDMRRCERVWQDIQVALSRQSEIAEALQVTTDYLQKTINQCQTLMSSNVSEVDKVGLLELKAGWKSVRKQSKEVPNKKILAEDELAKGSEQINGINTLQQNVNACEVALGTAIETREKQLVVLAAEALEKQQALDAAKEQQQIAEETEEQRTERLSSNYEYYTLVKRVAPEFPRRALRGGFTGYVVIEYMINPEGEVMNPVVIESQPNELFDKAALTAIKQWQYKANFVENEPDNALARTRMLFSYSD